MPEIRFSLPKIFFFKNNKLKTNNDYFCKTKYHYMITEFIQYKQTGTLPHSTVAEIAFVYNNVREREK